jgi:hypothetical protein
VVNDLQQCLTGPSALPVLKQFVAMQLCPWFGAEAAAAAECTRVLLVVSLAGPGALMVCGSLRLMTCVSRASRSAEPWRSGRI